MCIYICTASNVPTCCVRARERVRLRSGAHTSTPAHASAFCRLRPRVARLAGVPVGVGVQREHRRVEHRVCVGHGRGMRRLSGPGGARPRAGRARRVVGAKRAVVRGGIAGYIYNIHTHICAAAHRRCTLACVCADVWAHARAGVHVCRYCCAYESRVLCMYLCVCMHYTYIYIYIYIYIHMYTCVHRTDVCIDICVLVREMGRWACMWLHRLARTHTCDCARRRCGRRHHVHTWVRTPGYIANAHVMYEYKYLSMQCPGM